MTKKTKKNQPPLDIWCLAESTKTLIGILGSPDESRRRIAADVSRVINELGVFLLDVNRNVMTWTDAQMDLSSSLHTYVRKYMDGPFSVILYRAIDRYSSSPVWHRFTSDLSSGASPSSAAENAASVAAEDSEMECILRLWLENGLVKDIESFREIYHVN